MLKTLFLQIIEYADKNKIRMCENVVGINLHFMIDNVSYSIDIIGACRTHIDNIIIGIDRDVYRVSNIRMQDYH